jgi:CO/xanthine dehydrogenase FAD-binding subunit
LSSIGGRRRNEDHARDTFPSVAAQKAHRLAASHRMSDERDMLDAEFVHERGEIVGEDVEVVTAFGLIGPAMAAAVETDATESLVRQGRHLIVPHPAAAG